MDFETTLNEYGSIIEERLKDFFEQATEEANAYHPFIGEIYEALEEFVLRKGKRLASCSTLMAYKGYKELDERILRVCCGIELYRHAILIQMISLTWMRKGGEKRPSTKCSTTIKDLVLVVLSLPETSHTPLH